MKRLITKVFIFLLPFLGVLAVEIFVFPIDQFTFRAWEALKVGGIREMFPGYFYPNQELIKLEEGDLGHHTPYAVKKQNRWVTDSAGFRKEPTTALRPAIVVVGDSNVAGAGVSQEETFAAVLGAELNVDTYPLAPANINTFLKDIRFLAGPPEIVIVASVERAIPTLHFPRKELVHPSPSWRSFQSVLFSIRMNPIVNGFTVPFDRVFKYNMLHYVRASVRRHITGGLNRNVFVGNDGATLFLKGTLASETMSEQQIAKSVEVIEAYAKALKARGSTLMFLPIPNKENIYGRLVGMPEPRDFLQRLTGSLRERSIMTVNTQEIFNEAISRGSGPLYLRDDSHWNSQGIRLAAEAVAVVIRREGLIRNPGAAGPGSPSNGVPGKTGRTL